VLRRHHGHQRLAPHLLKAFAPVHAGPFKHQRQLRAPGVQQVQCVGLWCGQHFHLQKRKLLRQCCQRRAPVCGQQLGGNRQRQALLQSLRQRQRLCVQLQQLRRQQPRLRFQRACCGGGARLAAGALKQLHVQLGFQVGHCHAHGRRHPPQRPRRSRKRAVVQHRQKQLHAVGRKSHAGIVRALWVGMAVRPWDQTVKNIDTS